MDLSVLLSLRNDEPRVTSMVRSSARLDGDGWTIEIIALDERSSDNTLSMLSILHGQVSALRSVQDVEPGTSWLRASRLARGRCWLLADAPFDAEIARDLAAEVLEGRATAAVLPGQLIAVDRTLAQPTLQWFRGGLVSAEMKLADAMHDRGVRPLVHEARRSGLRGRAKRWLRAGFGRLGLTHLDRPTTRG